MLKYVTVKSCIFCSKLQYSDDHNFVNKKVLVLNDEILFADNKKWLFEPNDAIFTISDYNYTFQENPEKRLILRRKRKK